MAKKRCHYCGKLFIPDPRIGNRQKACSIQCQRLRKKENNRLFSKNNPGYWQGRYEYVKEWRKRNPEYQRQWRQRKKQKEQSYSEIQSEILRKAINSIEKNLIVLREIQAEIILKTIGIKAQRASFISSSLSRYKPR